MKKKDNLKILKFPNNIGQLERQVEAILFAAEEPLDIKSIQEKLKTNTNVVKILESLEKQYQNRGINLVFIANKLDFIYFLVFLYFLINFLYSSEFISTLPVLPTFSCLTSSISNISLKIHHA